MKIYTVYDVKARYAEKPFFMPTDIHAYRAFQSEVNRPEETNILFKNPGDFELRHIGEFDPDTGVITATEHTVVATGPGVQIRENDLTP